MDYTRDAILTIRRNAGKVPREQIAATLGWTVGQLERVASEHGYSLTIAVARPDPSQDDPTTRSTNRAKMPTERLRTVQATAAFRRSDLKEIDQFATENHLRRSKIISYIVETALARGVLADFVKAARDADRTELVTARAAELAERTHAEPQVG